jgi:drug/metabolite transporter (DMT)-like permease
MFAALLTTLLFSVSAIFGRRVAESLSGPQANLGRLAIAAILLGLWSHWSGFRTHPAAFVLLCLSGCVGFGVGDLSMFQAYRRIGTRRTVILIQCLAAPFGAVGEWLWLGHAPSLAQASFGLIILAGVGVALMPATAESFSKTETFVGSVFGVAAALGQAAGAVLSRKAYSVAAAAGEAFKPTIGDSVNAAYQRMLGGMAISLCCILYVAAVRQKHEATAGRWARGWPWVIGHALAGPAAGVTCFQWALITQPASIVLPIVATTPLAVLPLAHFFDDERVTRRALFGSLVAVAGVIGLVRAR